MFSKIFPHILAENSFFLTNVRLGSTKTLTHMSYSHIFIFLCWSIFSQHFIFVVLSVGSSLLSHQYTAAWTKLDRLQGSVSRICPILSVNLKIWINSRSFLKSANKLSFRNFRKNQVFHHATSRDRAVSVTDRASPHEKKEYTNTNKQAE